MHAELIVAFCRKACNASREEAEAFLTEHPDTQQQDLLVRLLRGEYEAIEPLVSNEPELARGEFGPGVSLLLLTCHSVYAGTPGADIEGCVRALAESGGDVTAGAPDGDLPGGVMTPLAAAVTGSGHPALVATLLELGAPADDPAALFQAAARQRWEAARLLLDSGADWNRTGVDQPWPVLHRLLDVCCVPEAVERLLAEGADPELAAGPLGETALHVAVRRRRLEMVELLVRHGADVHTTTAGGMSAWRHALRRPFPEIAERLAVLGADPTPTPADELVAALREGEYAVAEALLADHPRLLADAPADELRALADFATQGKLVAVAWMLDHGAPIDARGLDGGTPLHGACWFGQLETARLLIEREAPLDVRGDDHDCTPLGWVAHGSRFSGGAEEREFAYAAIAHLLLEAGAPLPGPDDRHDHQQLAQAAEPVKEVLRGYGWEG